MLKKPVINICNTFLPTIQFFLSFSRFITFCVKNITIYLFVYGFICNFAREKSKKIQKMKQLNLLGIILSIRLRNKGRK